MTTPFDVTPVDCKFGQYILAKCTTIRNDHYMAAFSSLTILFLLVANMLTINIPINFPSFKYNDQSQIQDFPKEAAPFVCSAKSIMWSQIADAIHWGGGVVA